MIATIWIILGILYNIYWFKWVGKVDDLTKLESALIVIFLIITSPLIILLEIYYRVLGKDLGRSEDTENDRETERWMEQREVMYNAWKEKQDNK